MPARHDVDGHIEGKTEHHRIARPAMVRRQQNAVPRIQRSAQPLRTDELVRFDTLTRAEVAREHEPPEEPRPERTGMRWNELIGFVDDDVLQRYGPSGPRTSRWHRIAARPRERRAPPYRATRRRKWRR